MCVRTVCTVYTYRWVDKRILVERKRGRKEREGWREGGRERERGREGGGERE